MTRICSECSADLPENARFCPNCGADTGGQASSDASGEAGGGESVSDLLVGFANGTAEEIKRTTAPILKSETSRKVAAGAAIGAVAAVALPFVSIGLGAVIGAGIAALRRRPG